MGGIIQPTQLPGADDNASEPQNEVAPFLMNHPHAGLVLTIHANGGTVRRASTSEDGKDFKVTIVCVREGEGEETGLALMAYMAPEHARSMARSLCKMADEVEEMMR